MSIAPDSALAPWIAIGVALACVLALTCVVLLLRPSGDAAIGRQLVELDRALRREIASGTQAGMSAAFDQVMQGNAAMQGVLGAFRLHVTDTMERFGRQLQEEQDRLRLQLDAKLDAMRAAVDEKLQSALKEQVGESFSRVAEQLAQVQQAVGRVQSVAGQVGDLQRLFSNVKSRGGWGEAHLEALLEDVLPGNFARNLRLVEGSGEAVEFALRVPVAGEEVWMPIDAKFPTEDYARLLDSAGAPEEEPARRGLERAVRTAAARIAKYVVPPRTVEFAVMYLPTDGLFAEIARMPGVIEQIRRQHRVMVMGPSLLPAFLHTVQVGHLTLTLERNAQEIGRTLGAVKGEWAKLDDALKTLATRAELVSKGIEETRRRTRAVGKTLRSVDTLDGEGVRLLELDEG